jgi:sugar lactone lactonase YvrE
MRRRLTWIGLCVALGAICGSRAASAIDGFKVETLAKDLAEPTALAIQPSTETIFVSESGTGKVLAFPKDKPDAHYVALDGFPKVEKSKDVDPARRGGLADLDFLDSQNLAVAYSKGNRKPAVSVFELPKDEADKKPLAAEAAKQTLGPADFGGGKKDTEGKDADQKDADKEAAALGTFFGVTVSPFNPPALFITNPGNSRGWLFKADIRNHTGLEQLKPFMATKTTPLAITMNRRGVLVVSANSGTAKDAPEGTLTFYNWKTGATLATFPTPLVDIVGLAYSPESGRLYAATLSRAKPNDAGIYRLDAATIENHAGMKAVKIVAVDRPTGLAFSLGNTLYVTAMGAPEADGKPVISDKGTLLKISGEF